MFKKFQSLPKQIEAVQFTAENKDRVFNALTGNRSPDFENGEPVLSVTTVHGDIAIVRFSDWIVKDGKLGTYYPIKDEIMQKQYIYKKEL